MQPCPRSSLGSILVLDDEPDTLDLIRLLLEPRGGTVETFSHGEDALQRVAQGGIAVVVLDLRMPDMSGQEFLRRLQNISENVRPRVMVLSGEAREHWDHQLSEYIAAYLSKPFAIDDFMDALNEVLHSH